MKPAVPLLILILFMGSIPIAAEADQPSGEQAVKNNSAWQKLAPGLELGVFEAPRPSEIGDSKIRILRIDPQHYQLKLLSASAFEKGRPLTARQWSRQHGLVAAINASMYQQDYRSSVSLMRTKSHVNNPRLSKDMTILAFDRKTADVPRVKIIDRQCENFEVWRKKYRTMVQSIRMISCTGKNVWTKQPQKWSTAAIGIDKRDRVLFIHVGSPYSTHDLINILQDLPLDISRAMYAEGGPQAQLYIKSGDHEQEYVGNYEIEIQQDVEKLISRPVPNVIGVAAKKKSRDKKKKIAR